MILRHALAITRGVLLLTPILAGWQSRLYLTNEATGDSGPGAIAAHRGDAISLNFTYSRNDGTSRWAFIQLGFDLAPANANAIFTDAEANTWDYIIHHRFN